MKSTDKRSLGAQALSRVPYSASEIDETLATGKRPPPRGALLLGKKATVREIASRLGVSKTLAAYWVSGERHPNPAHVVALEEEFGVPASSWEPPTAPSSSPLPPWLRRMAREGLASVDNDPDEVERTATLVAETLAETLVRGELAMFEDVLRALRPYA